MLLIVNILKFLRTQIKKCVILKVRSWEKRGFVFAVVGRLFKENGRSVQAAKAGIPLCFYSAKKKKTKSANDVS
jgi:hypothetical protein